MKPTDKGTVLVTGGTGYIGSHTAVELLKSGYQVAILDNCANSSTRVLPAMTRLSGAPSYALSFFQADLRSQVEIEGVFAALKQEGHPVDSVMHFAALKAAGDSVRAPLDYYETNIGGTVNLLRAMAKFKCRKIVFSSSACVYGNGNRMGREGDKTEPVNPYGTTKLVGEQIIKEFCDSKQGECLKIILRYYPRLN